MTEKELKVFTINYIEQKIKASPDEHFIRYTYFELKIKNNLTDKELKTFLRINKDYFENQGYKVYLKEDEQYLYKNAIMRVQTNELMIAIKEEQ